MSAHRFSATAFALCATLARVSIAAEPTPATQTSAPTATPAPAEAAAAAPAASPAPPAEVAPSAKAPVTAAPVPAAPAPVRAQSAPVVPLALGLPPQPSEPPVDDAGVPDDGSLGNHQTHFYATLGLRTTRITNSGFDVFASDDALVQASLTFGRVLYATGQWSFATSLGWEYGSRSATVRGAPTSLDAHRFTLNPELRYHFVRRLYAFGRLGLGGALVHTEFTDPVTSTRTRDPLRFTFDADVGAAFEVFGHASGAARSGRGWIVLDGGYLVTSSTDLVYENASASPARAAPISLGSLALSGMTGRVSAVVTF